MDPIVQAMRLEPHDFPLSSTNQKRSEVEALMRLHQYSLSDACEVVSMTTEEYLEAPPSPQSRISYLPTPEQIAEMAEECRRNRESEPDPDFDLRYDDVAPELLRGIE